MISAAIRRRRVKSSCERVPLDTNLPSELVRKSADGRVERWFRAQTPSKLHLSAITVGELRKGIARLPFGKRRSELDYWLNSEFLPLFPENILPVTKEVAERWGELDALDPRLAGPSEWLMA